MGVCICMFVQVQRLQKDMRWAEDFGGSKESHAQAQAAPPTPRGQAAQHPFPAGGGEEDELLFMDPPFSPITSEEEHELLAMLEHRLGGALSDDEEEDEDEHAGQVLDDRRVTTLANLLHAKHLTHQWLKVRHHTEGKGWAAEGLRWTFV